MCEECGCHEHKEKEISLNIDVNHVNNTLAHQIWHNLQDKNILCINLMGSPGSGKTTFIENLSKFIDPKRIAVIQGDLESDIDKKRLEKSKIYTYQINTHSGCHLNAEMVNKALLDMSLEEKEYLIIENVGNLVCPAGVKIGQHMDMIVSSTTEGSDKPKKYPHIFHDAKLVLISKYDLKEHVGFDEEQYMNDIKDINAKAKIIKTSSKEEESFKEVSHFIKHERDHLLGNKHEHGLKK